MIRALAVAAALLFLAPLAAADQQPPLLENDVCAPSNAVVQATALPSDGAPEIEGAPPEPLWMNHCNATQSCSDGSQVSCEGHVECTVQTASVTCDGVVHECPSCSVPSGCVDPAGFCGCRASGGTFFQCNRDFCSDGCGRLDPACTF